MKSVPEAVRSLIQSDDVAWQAFQSGILNLRAYAEQIQPVVEERCWKSVQLGTIVVALSRFRAEAQETSPLKPQFRISSFSVRRNIAVLSYDRAAVSQAELPTFFAHSPDSLQAVTIGAHEVTYILPTSEAESVGKDIPAEPKSFLDHAVAVTVRLPADLLREPNLIYALLARVAVLDIDVIEIVSTHSEITIVTHEEQLEDLLKGIQPLLQ